MLEVIFLKFDNRTGLLWLILFLAPSLCMASSGIDVINIDTESVCFGTKNLSFGDDFFQLFSDSEYELEAEPGGYACFFGEDKIVIDVSENGRITGFHFFFEFTPRYQSAREEPIYTAIYFLDLKISMENRMDELIANIEAHGFEYEIEERGERADIRFWLPNGDTVFVSYRDKQDGFIRSIQYHR